MADAKLASRLLVQTQVKLSSIFAIALTSLSYQFKMLYFENYSTTWSVTSNRNNLSFYEPHLMSF